MSFVCELASAAPRRLCLSLASICGRKARNFLQVSMAVLGSMCCEHALRFVTVPFLLLRLLLGSCASGEAHRSCCICGVIGRCATGQWPKYNFKSRILEI
jgi:hypothetical protein